MRGRRAFVDDALVQGGSQRPPSAARASGLQQMARAAAAHGSVGLPAAAVLALQRSAGNAAAAAAVQVQRLGCEASRRCGGSADGRGQHHEEESEGSTADDGGRVVQRDLWILDAFKRALREKSSQPDGGPCLPIGTETPPWMPSVPRRLPIKLGRGTRRHPKLKAPEGPSGAKCRGACGPDCPDTCKSIGTYRERYLAGGCKYTIEFPAALQCGTHTGCRHHDACFDTAVSRGESHPSGPLHRKCNQDAVWAWGPMKTKSWKNGGEPYDAWWYFVDSPVIVKSARARNTARSSAAPRPPG